ncbi:MAG: oligosaccharide flippase family protein [Sumerlaeia bacterium]
MSIHYKKASIDLRYRIAAIAFSMAYGILASRFLGAEGRGAFVLQTLLVQGLCLTFLNGGLGVALQTVCARRQHSARQCNRLAVVLSLALSFLAILLFSITQFTANAEKDLLLFTLISAGFCCTIYQSYAAGILNGLGEVIQRAKLEFLQSLALVTLAVVLIAMGQTTVFAFVSGFYVVLGLSTGAYFQRVVRFHRGKLRGAIQPNQLKELLQFGSRVYVGEVAASGRFQLDQLIVSAWFGNAGLGLYQQAQALARRGLLPSQSYATSSWQPVAQATPAQSREIVRATWTKVFQLSLLILLGGWFCAPLIPVIYGEDFREAVPLFRLMLPGILLQGSVQVIAVYLFAQQRKPGLVALLNWCSVILQVGLMLIAYTISPTLTAVATGAAVAWVLTAALFWGAYLLVRRIV